MNRLPDISVHLRLMDDFIAGAMSAPAFAMGYLTAVKQEQRLLGNHVFHHLQVMFEDADAYVAYPELRMTPRTWTTISCETAQFATGKPFATWVTHDSASRVRRRPPTPCAART